jgi:hypothetical protein
MSQSPGETTSNLLLAIDSPQNQGNKKIMRKKHSSCFHPKLSNKRGSTVTHKAQNTKCQHQDWTPKE